MKKGHVPQVPAKLKVNGELSSLQVEVQNDEVILLDLTKCHRGLEF